MALGYGSVSSTFRPMADVLKWEVHPAFCRLAGQTFKNTSGAALDMADPVGLGVKLVGANWEPAAVADIGGILIRGSAIDLANNAVHASDDFVILVKGPALVNIDQIKDSGGYPYVEADLLAALLLLDIKVLYEAEVTAEQTT